MYICYTYHTKKRGPSSCVVGNQVQFVVYRWFLGTLRAQSLKKWTAEWKTIVLVFSGTGIFLWIITSGVKIAAA